MTSSKINRASRAAGRWIEKLKVQGTDAIALRDLGLLLCGGVPTGWVPPSNGVLVPMELPSLSRVITMDRSKLLSVARCIATAEQDTFDLMSARVDWAAAIGGLALSYARVGDLCVVAALLQSAAGADLDNSWIREAQIYLLDQQQPSGCFGLISAELALAGGDIVESEVQLRLTVECLWALSAIQRRLMHGQSQHSRPPAECVIEAKLLDRRS
jgi:hypothetical protein